MEKKGGTSRNINMGSENHGNGIRGVLVTNVARESQQ
jgi:hypothetical protein